MRSFRQYITELLDQPLKWKWGVKESDRWIARFTTPNGLAYDVMFAHFHSDKLASNETAVELGFAINDVRSDPKQLEKHGLGDDWRRSQFTGVTKTGDELYVFATVVAIVRDYLSRTVTGNFWKYIAFSAKEPSRKVLYDRFAKMLRHSLPAQFEVTEHEDDRSPEKFYRISRKEEINEVIRKLPGGQFRLYSHKGKNLGTFPTRAGAEKHEREVQYFKRQAESVQLTELLDKPLAWKWAKKTEKTWTARFTTPSGVVYLVGFDFYPEKLPSGQFQPHSSMVYLAFGIHDSTPQAVFDKLGYGSDKKVQMFGATKTGDELYVFATVVAIVKAFYHDTAKENVPWQELAFSASEPSRRAVYDRFITMIKRAMPGKFETGAYTDSFDKTYRISKIAKPEAQ